ncbi:MAG: poly(beta-D-mannuronate) lyase [Pseudomonadota bacterium]|nr:poly(beta-D-mannuronate) lyase [Pseudomonadota bacterium]
MKIKAFALCAIAAAITGCDVDSDNNPNTLGSISLSGTPTSGETLTASVSDPDGISSEVNYFWYADNQLIADASGASFTLTDEQIGSAITVQGSYTDDGGINESHVSEPTSDVMAIAFESSIAISGDVVVGGVLTAAVSDENGVEPESIVYTWFADDVAIENEVTSTITLTESEFGKVISVSAAFTDNRGFDEAPMSEPTDPVGRVNSEGAITIVGTPTVGNTLTTEISDEDGATGEVAYQWYGDDAAISGATQSSYVVDASLVGQVITVEASYTDDNGFEEVITSEPTIPVNEDAVDEAGSIEITGTAPYLVDGVLTATLTDNNGFDEANVEYTWFADGVAIADSNSSTFTPSANAGAIISVEASYTDNDGFEGSASDAVDTIVYTTVVNDKAGLESALNSGLADGDVLGLNTNVYADLAPILLTSAVTLAAVEGETPVISGEACINVASTVDGAAIKGMRFENIDTALDSYCESEAAAVIYSEGDNFTFAENTMDGDQTTLNEETYHWLVVNGEGAMVERNTFRNRNNAVKGSVIKLSSSGLNHTIQYNLFENADNPNFNQSSLLLLNVGSTTGSDAAEDANFVVQYNRIDNFTSGRRLMRVQTSGATIQGNTIIDAKGGISLEDGGFNTVADNIIIRTTDISGSDERPSGVLMTPLGHTVTNNYIAGIRSGNKEAGGLVFTANPFSQADGGVPNAGNQAVLDGSGDLTLTVTNNTVLNSLQPIVFSTEIGSRAPVGDCDELTADNAPILYGLTKNFFVIDFDANAIANGFNEAGKESTLGLAFDSEAISSDHAFEYDCDLINHEESLLSNNFGFTDSYASGDVEDESWVDIRNLNGNGEFDTDGAIDQNPADNGKEVPEFVTATNGLIETDPNGAQAVAGAKGLYYIQSTDVGAGSTWTADN